MRARRRQGVVRDIIIRQPTLKGLGRPGEDRLVRKASQKGVLLWVVCVPETSAFPEISHQPGPGREKEARQA